MSIPIGIEGRVQNGEHPEMRVRVEDDTPSTGGYLVYKWWKDSDGPNANAAFDDWVESKTQLEEYFAETGWAVVWDKPSDEKTA